MASLVTGGRLEWGGKRAVTELEYRSGDGFGRRTGGPMGWLEMLTMMGLLSGLVMAGQLVHLSLEGDTALWALSFALVGSGLVCVLTGVVRGPHRG